MHWKFKAKLQNIVSLLPSSTSYAVYYWIQRNFGSLRRPKTIRGLTAGINTWKRIIDQGYNPSKKVFLEIGTGWIPLVPMVYWLMGAEKTITIDLNPYLKAELVKECLLYISENKEEVLNLLGIKVDMKRFDDLLTFGRDYRFSLLKFLDLCQVDYIAPGDAANIRLPNRSIDYHTSYTVFEHIPLEDLRRILKEGNRIIKNNGLFIHRIDYSDHFSHSDKSISAINFLQYSDDEWKKFVGNKYMYMNRLRHDDFINLFKSVGHSIVETQLDICQRTQELLRSGNLETCEQFSSKPEDVLSIVGAWIISKKNN